MADKDITIGIKAVGAQTAAKEIARDTEAIKALGNQAQQTDRQIDTISKTGDMFTATTVNMRGGLANLGLQLQDVAVQAEMGTDPLRIISQQVPQLLGGFGAFGALAGAAIGIGVPLAASLFKIGDGASKSADDIKSLDESLSDLKEAYEGIYKLIGEDQEEAAKSAAKRVADAIKGINTQVSIDTDAASLDAAREKASAQLKLVQDRIRLAELEKQVATATGNDALRLAKEREATVRRIYETELQISEVARKQALSAAQAKVAGAGKTLGQTAAASLTTQQQLTDEQAKQDLLLEKLQQAIRSRIARIAEIDAEIKRVSEIEGFSAAAGVGKQEIIGKLEAERNRLNAPSSTERDLAAEAAAMQSVIDQIRAQSEAASTAQQSAADAMNEAARALVQLKETQDVERKSEAELKATEAIGQVGRDVTQAALDAITAIKDNAASQNRPVNPGEQEAIGRIQGIINDNTPDAQQGGRLAGILQSLGNTLTAKDQTLTAGINRLISLANQQDRNYKALFDRVADLESRVNQPR